MQVYKVLHITTHLGGGVGGTVLNYFLESNKHNTFSHEVMCLGYSEEGVFNTAKSLNVPLSDHMWEKQSEILRRIPEFDIVLIHWWNHPLLYDFLVKNELPPCRLIMWGHNSGFNPPNVYTKKILLYPDVFVFTTPLTYKTKEVQSLPLEQTKNFFDIFSADNVDKVKDIKLIPHKGFNIGYIGTVDYAKLHPNFLKICERINIPDVKFIVVGGLMQGEIEEEARQLGILDKFEFTGIVRDLNKFLPIFDVFGYPLASYHYGTCDLVLQLAMAAGVVPVVFNNPMECYMVKNYETGIIVKNEDEYVKAIEYLYKNERIRKELSCGAKRHAINTFTLKKLYSEWEGAFNMLLKFNKTPKKWDINKSEISYKDVFLEALGDYGKPFADDNEEEIKKLAKDKSWQTRTKGSSYNYSSYFPDDIDLKKWCRIMKENA